MPQVSRAGRPNFGLPRTNRIRRLRYGTVLREFSTLINLIKKVWGVTDKRNAVKGGTGCPKPPIGYTEQNVLYASLHIIWMMRSWIIYLRSPFWRWDGPWCVKWEMFVWWFLMHIIYYCTTTNTVWGLGNSKLTSEHTGATMGLLWSIRGIGVMTVK